jgi:hypothetical protein
MLKKVVFKTVCDLYMIFVYIISKLLPHNIPRKNMRKSIKIKPYRSICCQMDNYPYRCLAHICIESNEKMDLKMTDIYYIIGIKNLLGILVKHFDQSILFRLVINPKFGWDHVIAENTTFRT